MVVIAGRAGELFGFGNRSTFNAQLATLNFEH
jgi:hypothetical protein